MGAGAAYQAVVSIPQDLALSASQWAASSSFLVALEAALALVWHSWGSDTGEAAALAGCVPFEADLLDKSPQDRQDEVVVLCDRALRALLAAQDI